MALPRWLLFLLSIFAVGTLVIGVGLWGAMRSPRVVTYKIDDPRLPSKSAPLRIVQLSDTHANDPFMTTDRLRGIVARANALKPDLIVLTGDYIGDTTHGGTPLSTKAAVQPFAALRARLGVYAVLGNHDHWFDAGGIRLALGRAGVRVLDNEHVHAGLITVAGVDDEFTRHADLARALRGIDLTRPIILLSHSPDVFPEVGEQVVVSLAGHTHGGQIALPIIGPLATMSRYGKRYAYGHIVEGGRHLIVSAGLGISLLPMRIGVPPEITVLMIY